MVLFRGLADPMLGDHLPLATVYGAVAFAVWFGGYRPALLAAVLGYLACDYLFVQPRGTFGFTGPHNLFGLILYIPSCAIIIGFGEAMRVSRHRFEELARQQDPLPPPTSANVEAIRQKHNLHHLAVIGFGLTLAVLVVGGVLGYANVHRLAENEGMVAHTHEVIGELESLLSRLKDAETGQRGYLLVGDEKYLQPYDEALRKVNADLAGLKELTSDNPDQQARLAVLEQKIAARLDELKRTIALMKGGDRPAALQIVRSNAGKARMDEVREAVAAMRQVEETLLRQRAAESADSFRTTILSASLTALIGVVLLGIVWYLSHRNLRVRQQAAEELARQREWLRVTFASIGDAVIATDTEGRITYLNTVAASLTGWTAKEAVGQPLAGVFRIVNEQTRNSVESPVARALREGVIVGLGNHTVLIGKDGAQQPIDDSAAPIRDEQGRVIGCVLIFRDITARKKAEEMLREADRRKDEFLATLSHELRNHLAPLRNSLEILRHAGGNAALIQEARSIMERQAGQLVRLVDDLLDISRISRGKLQLRKEQVELADVIRTAIETARPLIKASAHELTVTIPPQPIPVQADSARLTQVFTNLLTNAAKYTEKAGHIRLTAERHNGEAVVSVRDSGIGIAAEHLPGLFKMFAQAAPALERAQGGLGIGLSLVKGLVELHGGHIEAKSDGPGKGSEFIVRLPIAG